MGFSWEYFDAMAIVGIVRKMPLPVFSNVLERYVGAGFKTIEITVDSPDFAKSIQHAMGCFGDQMNIGAGTVCNTDDFNRAVEQGVHFIVTPNVNEKVIRTAVDHGLAVVVGAYTPTEVYHAWQCGASLIKLFPARSLGADYLKDLKSGPMSSIDFLPTGGVRLGEMRSYLEAGARGFGMGSLLFDKELIADEDWDGLTVHLQSVCDNLKEAESSVASGC